MVARLNAALELTNCAETKVTLEFVLGPGSPIPDEVERHNKLFRAKGIDWEELLYLLDARQRFFEIDTRFGHLGPKGIFESLDSAGVLNHRLEKVGSAECEVSEPPQSGRARIRGAAIRRLAAERSAWRCDWQCIIHCIDGRMLDLSNPFAAQETWRTSSGPDLALRPERLRILNYLENLRRRA